jgi:hypothetical protein
MDSMSLNPADPRLVPPKTKAQLAAYVKEHLGVTVPSIRVCPDHAAPLDYLAHTFFLDTKKGRAGSGDSIVWANRAGGKTRLAAVATLLDAVFKPGCHVRILGGSGEQSSRLYDYVQEFLNRGFAGFLAKKPLKSGCAFHNGSTIEILTQSPTSVRGQHVQKLRCDEVELFDPDVFAAAKFATISRDDIRASMELISTMHRPYGLMHKEVTGAADRHCRLFKWCLWETIRQCQRKSCRSCPLQTDCGGKARKSRGYVSIDDAIAIMRRSSRASWEAEMLCLRPARENLVFTDFDREKNVAPVAFDAALPLYRTIDFGFTNPFVCLWIQPDAVTGTTRVIAEYVRTRRTVAVNAGAVKALTPVPEERVTATFCDPAGQATEGITGRSCVAEMGRAGIRVRARRSAIFEGLDLLRAAILSGDLKRRLIVSPQCPRLIEALECYHYADSAGPGELPLKDGVYDHPIDALRYYFINASRRPAGSRNY